MAVENSVRLDILLRLKERFEDVNVADDGMKFTYVKIGALGAPDHTKAATLGIVVGREVKTKLSRATNASLPVDFEFQITANQDQDAPPILAEWALSVVQQVVNTIDDLGGLIMMVEENSNTLDLDTYSDRTISGVVQTTVYYRHAERDVRSQNLTA